MKCKKCGTPVNWRNDNGKWECFNLDGEVHWDLCSKLTFVKIQQTGRLFTADQDKGYLTELKKSGIQWFEQHAKPIRGEKYHPSGECQECCSPWEVCEFPCPDAI